MKSAGQVVSKKLVDASDRSSSKSTTLRGGEQLLTMGAVANCLQVSARTVRRMVAAGLLPYYRLSGKVLRFHPDEISAALQRIRVPARAET